MQDVIQSAMDRDTKWKAIKVVRSRDRKTKGVVAARNDCDCEMGYSLTVKWERGNITRVCTTMLTELPDGSWGIDEDDDSLLPGQAAGTAEPSEEEREE